jgi:holo-[acyl-carrier protein] synthase
MIHGIGTDLCAVSRMEAVLARRGPRFAAKLLMPAELAQFESRGSGGHPRRAAQFLATRFAAKEALGKATGLAVRPPCLARRSG